MRDGLMVSGMGARPLPGRPEKRGWIMDSEITARHFEGIEFVDTRIDHNETGFDAISAMAAAWNTRRRISRHWTPSSANSSGSSWP